MIKQVSLSFVALTTACAVSHAVVVGAWNEGQGAPIIGNSSFDISSDNNVGAGQLTGIGGNTGDFLSYYKYQQIATKVEVSGISDLYLGTSVSSDTSGGVVIRDNRFRFTGGQVDPASSSKVQVLTTGTESTQFFSGVFAMSVTDGTQIGDITSMDLNINQPRTVRWWVELGDGTTMVSDTSFAISGTSNYAFDSSAITWNTWAAADFETGTGTVTEADFTWSESIGSALVSQPVDTDEVAFFGYTWEETGTGGMSMETAVINAIPEPSAFAAMLGLGALAIVARRRR